MVRVVICLHVKFRHVMRTVNRGFDNRDLYPHCAAYVSGRILVDLLRYVQSEPALSNRNHETAEKHEFDPVKVHSIHNTLPMLTTTTEAPDDACLSFLHPPTPRLDADLVCALEWWNSLALGFV